MGWIRPDRIRRRERLPRRARLAPARAGRPGTSINFGPWSAGMADAESRARLDQRGVRTLSPADALAGLADAMAVLFGAGRRGPHRLGPLPSAVSARRAGGHSLRSWSARSRRKPAAPPRRPPGKTQLVERLTNAPVQQRKKLLTDYLRDAVAEVTRVDASGDPRGRRVLRPRHGFADGRRTAAPHRTGRRQARSPSRW